MQQPLSNSPSREHKPPEFIQRGKILIVRRQFQEAVKVCRLGLLAHPGYVEGRLVLGMALMALARHDEVLAEIRVALELDEDNAMAHLLKGEALYYKRDFEQAREVLAYAQVLDPHNEKVRKLLDEIEDVVDYGGEPGPRHKTETKVYPAQRAQTSAFAGDPSDVLSYGRSFGDWDVLGDEDEPTSSEDVGPVLQSLVEVRTDEVLDPMSDATATDADEVDGEDSDEDYDELYGDEDSFGGEEEEDEEFTTAPFLPPSHLGHRLKLLDSEWTEPTVTEDSEGREDSVIIPIGPEDLTVEESAVDKVVVDVRPDAFDDDTVESGSARMGWPETPPPTADDPLPGAEPGFDANDEDPTLVPGQSAEMAPPLPLSPVSDDGVEDPKESATVIPGRVRTGPLSSHSIEEDDEEEDTVVNADAPPPEALFGEEESLAALTSHPSEPVPAPLPHLTGPLPRAASDPTKALGLDVNAGSLSQVPSVSDVEVVSGIDVAVEPEDDVGTREMLAPESRSQPGLDPVAEVSSSDVYAEDLYDLPPEVTPDPISEGAISRDPFDAAIRASADIEPEYPVDYSEISVEMLPDGDDDVEPVMPPLPPDAQDSQVFELSAEDMEEAAPILSEPVAVDEDDSSHATRVNFDAPADEFDEVQEAGGLAPPEVDPALMYDYEMDGQGEGYENPQEPEPHYGSPRDPEHPEFDHGLGLSPDHPEHLGPADMEPAGIDPRNEPLVFDPMGEAQRYVDPPGQYDVPYGGPAEDPMAVYPAAGDYGEVEEDDDVSLEPDDSADQRWEAAMAPPARTAAMEEDGREYAYPDEQMPPEVLHREPTRETSPEGPQGVRQRRPSRKDSVEPDGMLEQMTGESGLFIRQAKGSRPDYMDVRKPRERHPDRTATSWLTILVGEPGSHRWIYLLLSAFGVLALAVAVGLAVRYYRLGEQIDAKRSQAQLKLQAGNMQDFIDAAQNYAEILNRRTDDRHAQTAHARVLAAIPFEFGDPIPQTTLKGGGGVGATPDSAAAEILNVLYAGSLERAATLILSARKQFPESPTLPYLAGRIALLEGNGASAVQHLTLAGKLDQKDTMILQALGRALAAQGKTEEALLAYRKALTLNPDHVASILGKARVLIQTRQLLGEAQVDLNTIVVGRRKKFASRGQRGWAYLLLARLLYHKGQLDQSKQHIKQAKFNKPSRDAPFLDELAGVLIDAHLLGEAENATKDSKKIMPRRPQPYYHMARIHHLNSRPRTALEELKRAKGLQYAAANLLRAQILVELNRLKEASVEVDRVLAMAEDLLEAHLVKAKVLAVEGKRELAEAKLKPLLAKHPQNARLLTAYGEVLLKLNQTAAARAKLRQAWDLDKHVFAAQLMLAEVFVSEGNFVEAQRSLDDAVRNNPGNVRVLRKQAELELDMGNMPEAASNYDAALRRSQNDPNIRLALAKVLTIQRKYDEAQRAIKAAEPHGAAGDALALARGRLALHRNKAPAAVGFLLTATKDRPKDKEGWSLLVQAYLMNEDFAAAGAAATTMEREFANSPEAAVARARIDINKGHSAQAIRRLRPMLSRLPASAMPPRERAGLLVVLGRAYQDNNSLTHAASRFEEAVKICPTCPEPHYRKGQIQDERGQTNEAIGSLTLALKYDKNYAEVHYDLGQIYERSGNNSSAISHYRSYLKFNPPKDLARAAEEAIQNLKSGGY